MECYRLLAFSIRDQLALCAWRRVAFVPTAAESTQRWTNDLLRYWQSYVEPVLALRYHLDYCRLLLFDPSTCVESEDCKPQRILRNSIRYRKTSLMGG